MKCLLANRGNGVAQCQVRQSDTASERIIRNNCDRVANSSAGHVNATSEGSLTDCGNRVRNIHACQTTTRECVITNGRDRIREGHIGETSAVIKSLIADGGDRAGDGHARQATAIIECPVADAGNGIGDDSVFTTCYQLITCRLDNGFAIVAGIIGRVVACHNNARQAGAVKECLLTDGTDRLTDFHTPQVFTISESLLANAGN